MSSSSGVISTITSPMTALFTPPPSCASHWTYERELFNSVPGGLLLQDAIVTRPDSNCFPSGFDGWGRAPSFIQVFSPGACPIGYTTANNLYGSGATTAVCCPKDFIYTSTVSTVNYEQKTAEYFGCTSIYDAGVTTVFAEYTTEGFTSTLDGTSTRFTAISGPVTMWAQPITVAFQKSDLSLFTTSSVKTAMMPVSPSTTSLSTGRSTTSSSAGKGTTPGTHSHSPLPSSNSGFSSGAIAGTVIGAVAVLGFLVGGFTLLRRKRNMTPLVGREKQFNEQAGSGYQAGGGHTGYPESDSGKFQHQYDAVGQNPSKQWQAQQPNVFMSELPDYADRRHELS